MLGVFVVLMMLEDEFIIIICGEYSFGGNNLFDFNYCYWVASVIKFFIVIFIFCLVEEGYFELDDKLFEYLEIFGLDNGIVIIIEYLLMYIFGMGDYFNDGGFYIGSDW